MKTVFVNPERCIGCKQCQIACAVEHSKSKNLYQAIAEDRKPRPRVLVGPGVFLDTSFPNKCRHCEPAPCMSVCPTGAISRDGDTGTVVVDVDKCITCAMCAMVCPFDEVPACVDACKVGALVFGDINELVKAARTKLAQTVSVAVGQIEPATARLPANVEAWRDLGRAVTQTGREVES
jgi:carbon-monoxide dehydrogenase iron sulfur subunit